MLSTSVPVNSKVQLKDDMVDKIFVVCFDEAVWHSDIKIVRQILESRYRNELVDFFFRVDQKYHEGYAHNRTIPLILSGEIADPYQYYIKYRLSESPRQQAEALSTLANALWIDEFNVLQQIDVKQIKTEIISFLESDNRYVRAEALEALSNIISINPVEETSCYVEACVKYINDFQRIPHFWAGLLLLGKMEDLRIESHIYIDGNAFQMICTKFRNEMLISLDTYEDLLTFALIAVIVRMDSTCLADVFSLFRQKRSDLIAHNHVAFDDLLSSDYNLSESLQHVMLFAPHYYTSFQKRVIQKHILNTDLDSAQQMKRQMEASGQNSIFYYNDCSLLDGSTFYLSYLENSFDDVIEYITRRLNDIDNQP